MLIFSTSKFIAQCNRNLWLRMIVCLGPGVLLTKLFDQAAFSELQTFSIYVFYAGAVALGVWSYSLRKLKNSSSDQEPESTTSDVKQTEAYTIGDLVTLCDGNSDIAIKLVEAESTVTPGISFSESVRRAYIRKQLGI